MKKIFLLILLVSLVGCAHVGTVKSRLNNAEFQAKNLPYRTLSVCVISEGSWPKESIQAVVNDVSSLMTEQVGIQLKIEAWIDHPIPSFTPTEGLRNLVKIVSKEHKRYDLVIGFSSRSVTSYLMEMTVGVHLAAIDDTYRKFIIIKYLDKRVLMHEICHAFVFAKGHSYSGVMSALLIKLPLLPVIFNFPKYVSEEDRQEILRNKWRSFNEKPAIPEEDRVDRIESVPD